MTGSQLPLFSETPFREGERALRAVVSAPRPTTRKAERESRQRIEAARLSLVAELGVRPDAFRCLDCPGALHTIAACPFRPGRSAELGPSEPEEVWVTDNGRDFYNATERDRLVGLGLVPAPKVGRAASGGGSTFRRPQTERRPNVATKSKSSSLAGLSKAKLRAKLLAATTIPDKAWIGAFGSPAREKGESREQYIKRVLA